MCLPTDPGTVANIGLGTQVAGLVAGTFGASNKAKAERDSANMQAQVARNNAQLETWAAEDALKRGQSAEATQRLKTANLKGKQIASMAARGIVIDEGSPLSILQDTDFMGEMDALTIRDNASREAWGHRAGAANYKTNAGMLDYKAKNANPGTAAATTFLTGAGAVAQSWYRFKGATTPQNRVSQYDDPGY